MAEKLYDVFISYSTKDSEKAFALLEVLEDYGLNCWIAPRNIPQGAMWAEEIDKAIQGASVFVVVVSSHSMESRQVPKEVALAVTACEGIFPFRIDDAGLQGSFRYYLSDYQFTDATENSKQKMEELAASICSSLGRPIPEKEKEPEVKSLSETIEKKPEISRPSPREEKKVQTTATAKKPGKGIIIGAVAAAAAVIIILAVVLSGKGSKEDSQSADASGTQSMQTVQTQSEEEKTAQTVQTEESEESSKTAQTQSDETEESSKTAQTQSEESEESSKTAQTREGDAAQTEETSDEDSTDAQTVTEAYPMFGRWERVAYKDKGAKLSLVPLDPFVVNSDGSIYTSLSAWSGAKESGTELPVLTVQGDQTNLAEIYVSFADDPEKYDLNATYSYKDSYNGEYDSSGITMTTIAPYVPSNSSINGDNPTDLTYDDVYPDVYLYLNITGTVQESPVKKEEADTWIVYKKKYPLIHSDVFPAFEGEWTDSMGNVWSFTVEDGSLAFRMTDTDGKTYAGDTIDLSSQDSKQKNFFERIQFIFDDYSTDRYAVVSFDGAVLELLDESWNSFTLTKN